MRVFTEQEFFDYIYKLVETCAYEGDGEHAKDLLEQAEYSKSERLENLERFVEI